MPNRTSDILSETLWPNTGMFVMARVLGANGDAITQGTISSISLKSYLDGAEVYSATPSVSSVIFDTYQTGARWEEDSVGYNVGVAIPGDAFPLPRKRYHWELILTPSSGSRIVIVGQTETRNMVG